MPSDWERIDADLRNKGLTWEHVASETAYIQMLDAQEARSRTKDTLDGKIKNMYTSYDQAEDAEKKDMLLISYKCESVSMYDAVRVRVNENKGPYGNPAWGYIEDMKNNDGNLNVARRGYIAVMEWLNRTADVNAFETQALEKLKN